MTRLLTLVVTFGASVVIAAQEPTPRKPIPTLTNDDVHLAKAAALAAKQNVTGEEIISRLERVQSFRSHAVIDYVDWRVDVVPPDSLHLITQTAVTAKGVAPAQLIVVRPFLYRLSPGENKWERNVLNDKTNAARRYITGFLPWFMSLRLRAHGFDLIDGTNALIYEVDQAQAPDLQYVKVWLRFDDGLPLRIVLNNTDGRPSYNVTFYDYNQAITINAPIP